MYLYINMSLLNNNSESSHIFSKNHKKRPEIGLFLIEIVFLSMVIDFYSLFVQVRVQL